MNDPYNSNPFSNNPYTPPQATVVHSTDQLAPDAISRLSVSESWKRKFRLIEKAGGPSLPRFRELPAGERFGLQFNWLGFFFGPIYYLIKGLWRQAVAYLLLAIFLVLVFEAIGLGKFARGIGYGFAAIYSFRANVSYYSKVVLGKAPWL